MLSYAEAYKIAAEVHKGQTDKAGGPYIDFLQNVADYLKNKGESEEVQTLAILQDLITDTTKKTPEEVIAMGVPADMVEKIQKMTYHKNQGWIDEYSCKLMAEGVPAEEANYEAREKEFVKFMGTLKDDPLMAKAKSAILNVLLEDKYIKRQERRELKTKFRLHKYKAAIEGGADGVDLGRKPLSGGTAQPDLFSMFHALKGTEYKLALGEDSIVDDHIPELMEANNVAVECLKDYNFPPEARQITTDVIFSPMPGGALTANTLMMRETKTFHLFPKVIENMSECVRRGGFASSVTPVSQFYFQQAYMNTLNQAAGRGTWFKMTEGYGKMLLGYQGKTPCEPDPELVKIAADQFNMKPFKEAYPGVQCAEEILEPGIPKAKALLEENGLPVTDETIFITGCLQTKAGNKGIEFLKGNRHIGVPKKDPNAAPAVDTKNMKAGAASTYRIALGNQSWDVQVQTLK